MESNRSVTRKGRLSGEKRRRKITSTTRRKVVDAVEFRQRDFLLFLLIHIKVLYSLKESFEQALRRDHVKAIVVTGANGKFSGGFDINTFPKIQAGSVEQPKKGFVSLEILNDLVAAAKKPVVAAIDGLALGGGLEVAMGCHARVYTPNAQLGLPELQLGVIPGFGGGILFWADSLGSKYICSRLEQWSSLYGGFFKPCAYLAERAAKGAPLSLTVDQGKSRL